MRSPKILIPRPPDPLQPQIDACKARIAARMAASERKAVPAPVVGPDALYDAAAFIRAHPVAVELMEAM